MIRSPEPLPRFARTARSLAILLGITAGAGLAISIAAPAPARAQDAAAKKEAEAKRKALKPKVESVDPAERFPGSNVGIAGTDLAVSSDEKEAMKAVEVTVGDEAAQVLGVSQNEIRVLIPMGVKRGKVTINVKVDGKNAGSVEFIVLDEGRRKEIADEDAKKEAGTGGQGGGFLSLDPPQFMVDRGQQTLRLTGKAEGIPDGATIELKLSLGSEVVDTTSAKVTSGGFGGAFGPYPKALFAAEYWVDALFDINRQTPAIRRKFKEAFKSDASGLQKHSYDAARQSARIGTFDQGEMQLREVRQHATASIARLREVMAEIGVGFGSAGRSGFAKGGKVDEAAWEEWIEKRAVKAFPSKDKPKRLKEMQTKKDFLTGSSAFADARWREFIDAKREEIHARMKENEAFRDRFLTLPDHEGLQRLGEAWNTLLGVSRFWSRELYERSGVPFDAKDPVTSVRSAAEVVAAADALEQRFSAEAAAAPKK